MLGCNLRSLTTVHVDAEGVGDGALDELPLDAVDATGRDAAGELGPGRRGHVEVVLVAISLVGDLFGNELVDDISSIGFTGKFTITTIFLPL